MRGHVRVFTVHRLYHAPRHIRTWIARGFVVTVALVAIVSAFWTVHTNTFPQPVGVNAQTEIDGSPLGPAHLCEVNFGAAAFGLDRHATKAKRAKDYAACMKAYKAGTFYNLYGTLLWLGDVSVGDIDHLHCAGDNGPAGLTIMCDDGYVRGP